MAIYLNYIIPYKKVFFFVNIPSTLIFSYGIIKWEKTISENEFWERLQSSVPIVTFKRISINKDRCTIQTQTVQFKFVASKISSVITLFSLLHEVKPSIASPVQCNSCLRFEHTLKYCRSDQICSHCCETKHSLETCQSIYATEPVYFFCKLSYMVTCRKRRE